MKPNNTIVRYADGTIAKGYTYNFNPHKQHFHLFPIDDPFGKGLEVWLRDLKAVFFARDLEGDPDYQEEKEFPASDRKGFRRMQVVFHDGEVLLGYTARYDAGPHGFFLTPVDPRSNNLRVFAVFAAVRELSSPGASERDQAKARSLLAAAGGQARALAAIGARAGSEGATQP